jgi:bifunctional non-homologous end joining protein LigD
MVTRARDRPRTETPNAGKPPYIRHILWRASNSRGRPNNPPPGFIRPCLPTVATTPPVGPGWAHELKHDGYRLQIHAKGDGRVRLYTMNGADWTDRYPRIVAEAARLKGAVIIDAEVICESDGIADFDTLQSRVYDHRAIAVAFDLLKLGGQDFRPKPLSERKAALKRLLARCSNAIQYVAHVEGDGAECSRPCAS